MAPFCSDTHRATAPEAESSTSRPPAGLAGLWHALPLWRGSLSAPPPHGNERRWNGNCPFRKLPKGRSLLFDTFCSGKTFRLCGVRVRRLTRTKDTLRTRSCGHFLMSGEHVRGPLEIALAKKTTCCCQQLTILFGKIPRVRPNSILEEQRTCFPLALLKQRKGKLLNDNLPPDPSPLMGGGKGRTSPMHQNTMPFDRNHLMLQGNAPVRLGRRRVSSINQLGSRDLDSPNKCSCWKSDGLPNSPKVSCVCVCVSNYPKYQNVFPNQPEKGTFPVWPMALSRESCLLLSSGLPLLRLLKHHLHTPQMQAGCTQGDQFPTAPASEMFSARLL